MHVHAVWKIEISLTVYHIYVKRLMKGIKSEDLVILIRHLGN